MSAIPENILTLLRSEDKANREHGLYTCDSAKVDRREAVKAALIDTKFSFDPPETVSDEAIETFIEHGAKEAAFKHYCHTYFFIDSTGYWGEIVMWPGRLNLSHYDDRFEDNKVIFDNPLLGLNHLESMTFRTLINDKKRALFLLKSLSIPSIASMRDLLLSRIKKLDELEKSIENL